MKILVCYKWVLDEADITVDSANRALNTSRAKYKISEIDRNALELGSSLKNGDDELAALTAGHAAKSSLKDVLSRGADKAYYAETEDLESSAATKVLAAAIKKIGPFDLIICGEGSSDNYSQQVGPRLAGILGYQLVTYASSVKREGNRLTVLRKLENDTEKIEVTVPTVLTVVSEINDPKVPGMKQILSARKKPSEALNLEDLDLDENDLETPVTVLNVGPSIMDRKHIKLNGGDTSLREAAEELVKRLKADKAI